MILAIDPGNEFSAYVFYDEQQECMRAFGKLPNDEMRDIVSDGGVVGVPEFTHAAIEMIASYGMPVGREIFDTCLWIGRYLECVKPHQTHSLVYRKDVKLHLCGSPRAKDSNIRRALIDRFGGDKETKKGGRLYKVSADVWSALAIAVTHSDSVRRAA